MMTASYFTYFFADNIKVIINGKEAPVGQLKPGMQAADAAKKQNQRNNKRNNNNSR